VDGLVGGADGFFNHIFERRGVCPAAEQAHHHIGGKRTRYLPSRCSAHAVAEHIDSVLG
jgi:hypothetical protein